MPFYGSIGDYARQRDAMAQQPGAGSLADILASLVYGNAGQAQAQGGAQQYGSGMITDTGGYYGGGYRRDLGGDQFTQSPSQQTYDGSGNFDTSVGTGATDQTPTQSQQTEQQTQTRGGRSEQTREQTREAQPPREETVPLPPEDPRGRDPLGAYPVVQVERSDLVPPIDPRDNRDYLTPAPTVQVERSELTPPGRETPTTYTPEFNFPFSTQERSGFNPEGRFGLSPPGMVPNYNEIFAAVAPTEQTGRSGLPSWMDPNTVPTIGRGDPNFPGSPWGAIPGMQFGQPFDPNTVIDPSTVQGAQWGMGSQFGFPSSKGDREDMPPGIDPSTVQGAQYGIQDNPFEQGTQGVLGGVGGIGGTGYTGGPFSSDPLGANVAAGNQGLGQGLSPGAGFDTFGLGGAGLGGPGGWGGYGQGGLGQAATHSAQGNPFGGPAADFYSGVVMDPEQSFGPGWGGQFGITNYGLPGVNQGFELMPNEPAASKGDRSEVDPNSLAESLAALASDRGDLTGVAPGGVNTTGMTNEQAIAAANAAFDRDAARASETPTAPGIAEDPEGEHSAAAAAAGYSEAAAAAAGQAAAEALGAGLSDAEAAGAAAAAAAEAAGMSEAASEAASDAASDAAAAGASSEDAAAAGASAAEAASEAEGEGASGGSEGDSSGGEGDSSGGSEGDSSGGDSSGGDSSGGDSGGGDSGGGDGGGGGGGDGDE